MNGPDWAGAHMTLGTSGLPKEMGNKIVTIYRGVKKVKDNDSSDEEQLFLHWFRISIAIVKANCPDDVINDHKRFACACCLRPNLKYPNDLSPLLAKSTVLKTVAQLKLLQ
jgi:hypothetical protein